MNANGATLRSAQFRNKREDAWRDLERLLEKAEKGGLEGLTSAELLRLPRLYRATLSSLSVARSISLDRNMVDYLENLTTRAFIFVYGPKRRLGAVIADFLFDSWPRQVRAALRPALLAFIVMMLGWALGHGLTLQNEDWFYTLIGEDLAGGRTPSASSEKLRETIFQDEEQEGLGLSIFASFLFTHNSRVAMLTFALGIALGVPTLLLLFIFGTSIGALSAVFASRDLGADFIGWLMIHGTTELFAIVLAAAAGLKLGAAIAFPKALSRRDALAKAGQEAGIIILGCIVMLFIAGLIEGLGRQLIQSTTIRYAVGGVMLGMWLGYFSFFGRERR